MTTLNPVIDRFFETTYRLLTGQPARDHCDACGRPARVIVLMPGPFGTSRHCDRCHETWHQTIRDHYTKSATEVPTTDAEPRKAAR